MQLVQIMQIIFGIITTQLILSLLCSLFLFVQFISNYELRHRKHNHIFLILLIVTFLQNTIELPMALIFLHTGLAANSSPGFCLFWIFCTCFLDITGILLMTFASIECYMFIFHTAFLNRHSIILRYIPMILCFVYPLFYVLNIVFFVPCTNEFYYFAFLCSGGCYLYDPVWNAITWIGNISLPIFIILLTNIFLIIRTIYRKNKMKQTRMWSKNRKMLLQLVSVASLYCLAWLPSVILILIVTFPPSNVDSSEIFFVFQYVIFMTGFTPLFYPFVCLSRQPTILNKIRHIYQRRHRVILIHPLQPT